MKSNTSRACRYWPRRRVLLLVQGLLPAVLVGTAWGIHPHVPFAEVVQRADIIYVGTVSKVVGREGQVPNTIVTDVTFVITNLINMKPTAVPPAGTQVTLTFAGGQLGDRGQSVSGVPKFQVGEEFVVFTRHDGGSYLNPLVGGTQGLFRVHKSRGGDQRYPLTLGNRGVTGRVGGELRFSRQVESIELTGVRFAPTSEEVAPTPATGEEGAQARDAAQTAEAAETEPLLRLEEFIDEIRATLRSPAAQDPALRGLGDTPEFSPEFQPKRNPRESDDNTPQRPDRSSPQKPLAPEANPAPTSIEFQASSSGDSRATAPAIAGEQELVLAPLCYCGYFDLSLVMEQVPTDWWEWVENNDAMYYYNQYMDVYRFVADDGSWGDNGENEFGGYPSSAELIGQYGEGWNGEIAVTWTTWSGCECCELIQADVFFNPAYSFWQNFADTLDQSGRVLYRPIVTHELGHSWGMQRGSCTEDYSYGQLSVMHAYYFNIVEDGFGFHTPEVWSIRRLYQDQTPITGFTDVGVESYYASGSLVNSTTNGSTYYSGDAITLQNITVENNSYAAVSGVRIRFFLSADKIITTGDVQMGSYWYWDSFSPETYSTASYSTSVPSIAPGIYYVGIIVTRNGDVYAGDDFGLNDATFLHDPITVLHPQPLNDYCFFAPPLHMGTSLGTTFGAFNDGSASCGASTDSPDVWYAFTAPCSGKVQFDTIGSSYDTVLSFHSDCPSALGAELACNDDCLDLASCVAPALNMSVTGYLRVSGFDGAAGDFELHAGYLPPAADMCEDSLDIAEGAYALATCGATTDGPSEPFTCDFAFDPQVESDVWYCYQSGCAHRAIIDACGSTYDTKLAVYHGCACPEIPSATACNDDSCGLQSRVALRTVPGNEYLIRVGGYFGDAGDGLLNIRCGGSGDADLDLDMDLRDAAAFQNCYEEDGVGPCGSFDLAGNLGIEADDWATFSLTLSGP